MLVFFSGYLYGFYFTGLGVMIGIIWVDLCKGLHKMVSTSKRMVVILDINDVAKKEEAMIIRRGRLSQIEYKEKYNGLSHLFYDKKWFKAIAEECNCNIEIHNQDINGYLNSKFRFNVFLTK